MPVEAPNTPEADDFGAAAELPPKLKVPALVAVDFGTSDAMDDPNINPPALLLVLGSPTVTTDLLLLSTDPANTGLVADVVVTDEGTTLVADDTA